MQPKREEVETELRRETPVIHYKPEVREDVNGKER